MKTHVKVTGTALVAFALTLIACGLVWPTRSSLGVETFVVAWGVVFPAALLAYPRARWRDPIAVATSVVVIGAGVVVATRDASPGAVTTGAIVGGLAFVANLMWRYERADEPGRVTLLWMGLATGIAAMAFGHSVFLVPLIPAQALGLAAFSLVPPALLIGATRPLLLDVRALMIEVLGFEVVIVAYVSLFVGATSTAELFGATRLTNGALAVIAAVAATGFHPLRRGLRSVVDELLFGSRPDPLEAAGRVADRAGDDPAAALSALRDAMVLPFASLWVDGNELANSGTPVAHTRRLALALGDDTVGEIVVGLRPGDLRLSSADERVLRIVAPLLAQTLRAWQLATDLQASRGATIAAIEEERRRLRRDLHDGLGPTLSGIAFTADAARNSLHDRAAVEALLRSVRAEASNAVQDIRRLVYAMRPPALDELGLVGALRQWAMQIRTPDGAPLRVTLNADAQLGQLPAAVEVAAYRIAVEALANVARHSGSDRADVELSIDDNILTVEVRDHGVGNTNWQRGVGLSSMTERANEIGGTVTAQPGPTGGRVVATLPLN